MLLALGIVERVGANVLYASIASILVYLLWAHFFDQAEATGNCFDGTITKIETISAGSGIRSAGTNDTDFYAHIYLENNNKIVKKIASSQKFKAGKRIKLREFRSEIRGVLKYEIANCN